MKRGKMKRRGRTMNRECALSFRDQFRDARYYALEDAEGYQKILFVLERLGSYLSESQRTLEKYKSCICQFVNCHHPNGGRPPEGYSHYFIDFDTLYNMVKDGRNDALHQGAVARILTSHSVQLSIILEDALSNGTESDKDRKIKDYMVRNPVCASLWQPIGFLRQIMLENSFSSLPFQCGETWYVVSDCDIARYLAGCKDRKKKLSKTLECVKKSKEIRPRETIVISPDKTVSEVVKCREWPILVKRDECEELLGIVAPFDLM